MTDTGITVVIPTHPARIANGMLDRALSSVWKQTLLPKAVVVAVDTHGAGAMATRNDGLRGVETDWVAFLDSDDTFCTEHLERLYQAALDKAAEIVYPWFFAQGWSDPLAGFFGKKFDPKALTQGNYIPVTVLAKTAVLQSLGGFQKRPGVPHEDWGLWLAALKHDVNFYHVPERTWVFNRHGGNTDGRADRGDAVR